MRLPINLEIRVTIISNFQQLQRERTPADLFMRRLLNVGDVVDKNAIFGARRSTTTALVVSGIRCTITYLLIPILAPFVGLVATWGRPISIGLSLFAMWMGVAGVRRFWIADHKARWSYSVFIGVVLLLLAVGIVIDMVSLFSV